MSTFDGIINELEGVSVDCFKEQNMDSRLFFLSHCHSDHYQGINSEIFISFLERTYYFIYTSDVSSIILSNSFPKLANYIKPLSVGDSHNITIPGNNDVEESSVDVTFIPAGHCPGSVMMLFTTCQGTNILYTGDFRLTYEDFSKIKCLKMKSRPLVIDKIYLDTTFWDKRFSYFPNRQKSCEKICNIIESWLSQHPDNKINLWISANIGTEYLYISIYNKLRLPIGVRDHLIPSYRQIGELENVFTSNQDARIFASIRNNYDKRVCNIRVSALKWRNLKEEDEYCIKEDDRFYSVCYSSHCSFEELKAFLMYFKPKDLQPCVQNSYLNNFSLQDYCKVFIDSNNSCSPNNVEYKRFSTIKCTFLSSDSDD